MKRINRLKIVVDRVVSTVMQMDFKEFKKRGGFPPKTLKEILSILDTLPKEVPKKSLQNVALLRAPAPLHLEECGREDGEHSDAEEMMTFSSHGSGYRWVEYMWVL